MAKTYWVETYGCQMNLSDSELMEGVLASSGYAPVSAPEDADVILVNTCAIREHAEQRVLGRVAELNRVKRERPGTLIGVCGCMAQRLGAQLIERAEYVDLVIGPDAYRSLPQLIDQAAYDGGGVVDLRNLHLAQHPGDEVHDPPALQVGVRDPDPHAVRPHRRGDGLPGVQDAVEGGELVHRPGDPVGRTSRCSDGPTAAPGSAGRRSN